MQNYWPTLPEWLDYATCHTNAIDTSAYCSVDELDEFIRLSGFRSNGVKKSFTLHKEERRKLQGKYETRKIF